MNIEITDLDIILDYLETTSLEPHDDYSSEFTYKEQKILYKYIKQLQQENKQLKDNWNKSKEYIRKNIIYDDVGMKILDPSPLEDYMQELEQGNDSNGNN